MGTMLLLLILAPKLLLRYHDIANVLLPLELVYFAIILLLVLKWLLVPHYT